MALIRILLYMLGSWVGGVLVTFLGVAYIAESWSYTTLWAVLSLSLAVALASALYADARVGRRPKRS